MELVLHYHSNSVPSSFSCSFCLSHTGHCFFLKSWAWFQLRSFVTVDLSALGCPPSEIFLVRSTSLNQHKNITSLWRPSLPILNKILIFSPSNLIDFSLLCIFFLALNTVYQIEKSCDYWLFYKDFVKIFCPFLLVFPIMYFNYPINSKALSVISCTLFYVILWKRVQERRM